MRVKLKRNERTTGVKISFNALAFYRVPPIPVSITIGYDRPSDREFLYIEIRKKEDASYSSPAELDNCFYSSLADSDLRAPLLLYYLKIFSKYEIFITIDIYKILQDNNYCAPDGDEGYLGMADNISMMAYNKYKKDMESYYKEFSKLIVGLDYVDPLELQEQVEDDDYMSDHYPAFIAGNVSQEEIHSERRNRLFLGEADFSFTAAFIRKPRKVPPLSEKIIATEYRTEEEVKKLYKGWDLYLMPTFDEKNKTQRKLIAGSAVVLVGKDITVLMAYFFEEDKNGITHLKMLEKSRNALTVVLDLSKNNIDNFQVNPKIGKVERNLKTVEAIDNIIGYAISRAGFTPRVHHISFPTHLLYLKDANVEMQFGIDARKIHETQRFKGHRYRYIHFNCPHDKSDSKKRTLPKILSDFFMSASKLQKIGDRIYMALPNPNDINIRQDRESYIYKVYDAAASAGYKLVKKRRFGPERYRGYWHVMTGESTTADIAEETRENIFQKIEPPIDLPQAIHHKSPTSEKEHFKGLPHYDKGHILPEDIHTEEGSSDYSDSDTDTTQKNQKSKVMNSSSVEKCIDENEAVEINKKAMLYYNNAQYPQAIDLFNILVNFWRHQLKDNKSLLRVLYNLGSTEFRYGQLNGAIKHLAEVVQMDEALCKENNKPPEQKYKIKLKECEDALARTKDKRKNTQENVAHTLSEDNEIDDSINVNKSTIREGKEISTVYWYEDSEMRRILEFNIEQRQRQTSNGRPIHLLGPLDNISPFGIIEALESHDRKPGVALIPFNLGQLHWVGLILEYSDTGRLIRANFYDSLDNGVPNFLNVALEIMSRNNDAVSTFTSIQNNTGLISQSNNCDCGPCTIENLLAGVGYREPLDTNALGRRLSHIRALELAGDNAFFTSFYRRQRLNQPSFVSLRKSMRFQTATRLREKDNFTISEYKALLDLAVKILNLPEQVKNLLVNALSSNDKEKLEEHAIQLARLRTVFTDFLSDSTVRPILVRFFYVGNNNSSLLDAPLRIDYDQIMPLSILLSLSKDQLESDLSELNKQYPLVSVSTDRKDKRDCPLVGEAANAVKVGSRSGSPVLTNTQQKQDVSECSKTLEQFQKTIGVKDKVKTPSRVEDTFDEWVDGDNDLPASEEDDNTYSENKESSGFTLRKGV